MTLCECRDSCGCEKDPGPASVLIKRGDKEMRVCTKCVLRVPAHQAYLLGPTYVMDEVLGHLPTDAATEEAVVAHDKCALLGLPNLSAVEWKCPACHTVWANSGAADGYGCEAIHCHH